MLLFYHCPQLRRLPRRGRVRNVHDAARIFAHRLAVKVFGRCGLCLDIKLLRRDGFINIYQARLGTPTGPTQDITLPVSRSLSSH